MKLETLSVRIGREVEPIAGDVAPAIHLTTTFERDADGEFSRGYSYSRADNPSRRSLEQCIRTAFKRRDALLQRAATGIVRSRVGIAA